MSIKSLCPICNSTSIQVKVLNKNYIIQNLEKYYNTQISQNLDIVDYTIYKCNKCGLEFAGPLIQGSNNFYSWIAKHSNYYPPSRSEWQIVYKHIMNSKKSAPIKLLEVGCGSGIFLNKLHQLIPTAQLYGLDTNCESVELCRNLNPNVKCVCETIELFATKKNLISDKFDYVVAFHCLEHVNDPKAYIESMVKLLSTDGKIFISTPYSPMSFESIWFDPLNHPPHHLTRWNYSAYNELARQMGLKIKFHIPEASSIFERTLFSLNLALNGPKKLLSKPQIYFLALRRFSVTIRAFKNQLNREKLDSKVIPDLILVEMSY